LPYRKERTSPVSADLAVTFNGSRESLWPPMGVTGDRHLVPTKGSQAKQIICPAFPGADVLRLSATRGMAVVSFRRLYLTCLASKNFPVPETSSGDFKTRRSSRTDLARTWVPAHTAIIASRGSRFRPMGLWEKAPCWEGYCFLAPFLFL